MILYTPVPPELIWATETNQTMNLQEIEHQGVTLLVQPLGMNTGRIVQIRSTDPYVFLRQEYQPGRVINFLPDLYLHDDRQDHRPSSGPFVQELADHFPNIGLDSGPL